jgi:radical SAM protein with 4Fe4S-binding SPASM domain
MYERLFSKGKGMVLELQKTRKAAKLSRMFKKMHSLFRYGTTDMFWAVEIQTSTKCNRRCWYCPSSFHADNQLLSIKTYKKIIDDLKSLRFIGRVSPSLYGEPLLDKRLPDFIKYTRKSLPGTYICIITNGDYLDRNMFNRLRKTGADDFVVTLHDNHMHKELKAIAKSRHVHIQKRSEIQLCTRGGLIDLPNLHKYPNCHYPSNAIRINHNGDVILCNNDFYGKYVFGNVNSAHIKDIWISNRYRQARSDLHRGIFNFEICKKCADSKDRF